MKVRTMVGFPLFPERASSAAAQVDAIYIILSVLYGIIALVIAFLIIHFSIKYHRLRRIDRRPRLQKTWAVELLFIGVPFVAGIAIFAWAAQVYFDMQRAPAETHDIYIVGKQWMWYAQHPDGRREINALHVPMHQPVRLIMTSQDVIHSYFIPAFRLKQDVLPGRYTTMWFVATRPGVYHLFCAEYCGADHSRMIGTVVVLDERAYQRWLSPGVNGAASPDAQPTPMAQSGRELFVQLGCHTCHVEGDPTRAPELAGVFGRDVALANQQIVTADEHYLRESILQPNAKIVAGYAPSVMPAFAGQITPQQLNELIQYIKALSPESESEVQP